jgi:hypothetical protein
MAPRIIRDTTKRTIVVVDAVRGVTSKEAEDIARLHLIGEGTSKEWEYIGTTQQPSKLACEVTFRAKGG